MLTDEDIQKLIEANKEVFSTKEDFENLPPVSNKKYLRPTRLCECDAPEIRAIAKKQTKIQITGKSGKFAVQRQNF